MCLVGWGNSKETEGMDWNKQQGVAGGQITLGFQAILRALVFTLSEIGSHPSG